MANITNSFRLSLLASEGVDKSTKIAQSSISKSLFSVEKISKAILSNTKLKESLEVRSQLYAARRREASKRQEVEDTIEASKVGRISSGFSIIKSSNTGPLQRLLGFLGFLTAGWLIENLPTLIFMGQEFISRVNKTGQIIQNFIGGIGNILTSFGQVLTGILSNVLEFDFGDKSSRIKNSFTELETSMQSVNDELYEAYRLLITPLSQSTDSEEEAPSLDQEAPNTLYPQPSPSSDGAPPDAGRAGYSKATKIPEKVKSDTKFIEGITNLAKKYNIPEDYLYTLMSFETGGSFSPSQKNLKGSGATGLIQFMPSTAKGLGTSTSELSKMSRSEQLTYVDKYFSNKGIEGGSLSDTYMAVLFPAAVGKPEDYVLFGKGARKGYTGIAYEQNKGLDLNGDGSVTKAEASDSVKKGLPKQSQVSQQSKPTPTPTSTPTQTAKPNSKLYPTVQPTSASSPVSTGTINLIPQTGSDGFIQGGSGGEGETTYATHFHLDYVKKTSDPQILARIREVAFESVKVMIARGSTVWFGNAGVYASKNDSTLKSQIAAEQRAHGKRSSLAVDMQEINPKIQRTFPSQPGSKTKFPFATGAVYMRGGYGREAEIIGSQGITVSHGAPGSSESDTSKATAGTPISAQTEQPTQANLNPQVRQNVGQEITPQRTGPTVVLDFPTSTASQQPMAAAPPSTKETKKSNETNDAFLLNRFIKQKLLLDLAYL